MSVSTEQLANYQQGLRQRLSQPLTAQENSVLETARAEAVQIAQRLVAEHGVKRVVLFGSVAQSRRVRPESDIDLVVEGMPVDDFYQIVGDIRTPSGRTIDLVRWETLPEAFRQLVLLEGMVIAHDR